MSRPFTADSWMPFGKYGPKKNDPRRLRDIPAAYLRWLSQQEILYYYPALADYLEARFYGSEQSAVSRKPSGKKPLTASCPSGRTSPLARRQTDNPMLRDFLKTLD